MTERRDEASPASLGAALSAWPGAVTLLTVTDGRDDIGTTVSSFCPVSADPPLVLASLIAAAYPAEVLSRLSLFAVTLLATGQRMLAGRFAAAGRPGARLLLDGVPHHRGERSGALIPDGGLAAFECEVTERVPGRRPPAADRQSPGRPLCGRNGRTAHPVPRPIPAAIASRADCVSFWSLKRPDSDRIRTQSQSRVRSAGVCASGVPVRAGAASGCAGLGRG